MLHPTEELLLECVRSNSVEITDVLESFLEKKGKIDWQVIAETIPYVYLKTKHFHRDFKIPQKNLSLIEQNYFRHIAGNELFKHEIKNLAREFKRQGIDVIFLKGVSLFTTVYGSNTDLRIMSDIDVLIRRERLWQAENVLKEMGYKPTETEEERNIALAEHFHFMYRKERIILELHWDIGEQWYWDVVGNKDYLDLLFFSSKNIFISGKKIKILSPAGNIFFACLSLDRDLFLDHHYLYFPFVYKSSNKKKQLIYKTLKFFYEIKKMIKYYGKNLNWDDLLSLSKESKKEYELFALLYLTKKAAHINIPENILREMKKNIFVRLYIFLCNFIKDNNLIALFFINKLIYHPMIIYLYIKNRKFYLLIRRFAGGRI